MLWLYALVAILPISIGGSSGLQIKVAPERLVVMPGEKAQVICYADVAISFCRITLPGQTTALSLTPKTRANADYSYYGAGLEAGQCGVTLPAARDKHNGILTCAVGTEKEPAEVKATMELIVARAPSSVDLDVISRRPRLNATCKVRGGRPAGSIMWYLDDDQVVEGVSVVHKGDLETSTLTLTRPLGWEDNGKVLTCAAGHPALRGNSSMNDTESLNVTYAPEVPYDDESITMSGFTVGKTGKVEMIVHSNPAPELAWTINELRVKDGQQDTSGKYRATSEKIDGDTWKATLHVNNVNDTDDEETYYLVAKNLHGEHFYHSPIYSSPEDPDVDFERIAIIGALIAIVLIIGCLIVIFSTSNKK